jgi:electron transfer flavoprotein alpha subunit
MTVLVFAESTDGRFKKAALEAVTLGGQLAAAHGGACTALVLGAADEAGKLGQYGAAKVLQSTDARLSAFDSQVFAKVIAAAARQENATVVLMPDTANGKSLLGQVAMLLEAGAVRGINGLPAVRDGHVEAGRAVFSGKASAVCAVTTPIAVMSVAGNTLKPEAKGAEVSVTPLDIDIPAGRTRVVNVSRSVGIVPLPEAEIVVSAGRGMKDPGNWGIVEELATELGATTACSRPVADSGWRPHHEHVGQTGIAIRPNLYIAIGISGAIQHLAGVNSSKVIVVINKDPEAPFFKAADYGVVGDLFEVVPRLTAAVRAYKAAHG